MLKLIKKFFLNLEPDLIIQAPARINLINPLDAVEGDYWMPSVAINGLNNPLSVFLYIKNVQRESQLKIYTINKSKHKDSLEVFYKESLSKNRIELKDKLTGPYKLIYASIYRLIKMNSYFEKIYLNSMIEIGILTTIPKQSGLGGSAAIIIAVLFGLAKYFDLYNNLEKLDKGEFPINKDIIAEMATKIEDEDLNITSGYGDRYVISRGGLSFCSYYGKLYHKDFAKEPLAIYDRIDDVYELESLPIIVCYSGVYHDSGDIHGRLRKLYLHKQDFILNSYKELAELAWQSRFAIMKQDWKLLGKYFKENTRIMNRVMKKAGYEYGIGIANNILITIIEEHPDVYAAKLTGAGGGGSVFALVKPNKVESVICYWRNKLNELIANEELFSIKFPSFPINIIRDLKDTKFFQIKIDKDGVKKL